MAKQLSPVALLALALAIFATSCRVAGDGDADADLDADLELDAEADMDAADDDGPECYEGQRRCPCVGHEAPIMECVGGRYQLLGVTCNDIFGVDAGAVCFDMGPTENALCGTEEEGHIPCQ